MSNDYTRKNEVKEDAAIGIKRVGKICKVSTP